MGVGMIWGLTTGPSAPVALFIWEKTLPDRFVGTTDFAFGILYPHSFQCNKRAIATGVECARCASNLRQPWRRRFFFEGLGRGLMRPVQLTDVDEAHGVEHIPH